jgi:hypothetical protein
LFVHVAFENVWQGGYRVIEIEFISQAVDYFQVLKEGAEILGPEYKASDIFGL